jgi:thioredoxin reductase
VSAPIDHADVLLVGAGPAGLSAATELKRLGVGSVVVIERESEAGGVPRHCGHPPFGMQEFKRVLTGPAYARRLARRAERAGVELRLQTSVVAIDRDGDDPAVSLTSPAGVSALRAERILLATGVRERTRAQRFASGDRPLGVMNTGALQAYAYLERLAPFRRPIIVGTELVALSSLLTCRAIGAEPVAMVETNAGPTVPEVYMALPWLLGIPRFYGAEIVDIFGAPGVEGVTLRLAGGGTETIACDGVVFTGGFQPEATLVRAARLALDRGTLGPSIDQFGRTSDPRIFAAGNLLRPVETAGWSWEEGRRVAGFIAEDMKGLLPVHQGAARLRPGPGVRYVVPQRLALGGGGFSQLQLRLGAKGEGRLVARGKRGELASAPVTARAEQRVLFRSALLGPVSGDVTISLEER